MASKDIKTKISPVLLKTPTDFAHTNQASDILDMYGFESCAIEIITGTLTGVDGSNYVTYKLQESDTTANADFTDVASTDLIGAYTVVNSTTKHNSVQSVGYKGNKRYVRAYATYTGTGISAGYVSVVGILSHPRDEPAMTVAAVSST